MSRSGSGPRDCGGRHGGRAGARPAPGGAAGCGVGRSALRVPGGTPACVHAVPAPGLRRRRVEAGRGGIGRGAAHAAPPGLRPGAGAGRRVGAAGHRRRQTAAGCDAAALGRHARPGGRACASQSRGPGRARRDAGLDRRNARAGSCERVACRTPAAPAGPACARPPAISTRAWPTRRGCSRGGARRSSAPSRARRSSRFSAREPGSRSVRRASGTGPAGASIARSGAGTPARRRSSRPSSSAIARGSTRRSSGGSRKPARTTSSRFPAAISPFSRSSRCGRCAGSACATGRPRASRWRCSSRTAGWSGRSPR